MPKNRLSEDFKKHRNLTLILIAGVIAMFGFCYMLVPIFEFMCTKIGINGKAANSAALNSNLAVDTSRNIRVDFTTTINGKLNFKFITLHKRIKIHPGETKVVYFYAENLSDKDVIVQAVPSVTPVDAARFLKKTECFCFTQQRFAKGSKANMPVYFFIDSDIPKEIKEVTLSYTLFDASGFEKKQYKTVGKLG